MQQHEWYYQQNKSEYNFVSNFTQAKKILEVGCGEGHFHSVSNCDDYVGLEFNTKAVEKCKAKNLTVFKQSIEDFAKENSNSFDVVCSFQVLEHVTNPIEFLQYSINSLKIGGYLIISVPAEDSFVGLTQNNILNAPPHHLTRWTDRSFSYLADKLDLELVQIHHEPLDQIHERWFASFLGQQIINRIFKKGLTKLFDDSIFDKLMRKSGSLLGLFLEIGIKNHNKLFVGHTVTVIYKKL